MDLDPDSLLGRLAQLPDPRCRAGRRYPLAAVLAAVRNMAISIFRWRGFRYAPDGWRFASANLHQAVQWLL